MKKDERVPAGLQSLSDARRGFRDNVGDWLRARIGKPPRTEGPGRRRSPELIPAELEPLEAPITNVGDALVAELPTEPPPEPVEAAEATVEPLAEARLVTVIGAPHPATRRLFADMVALVEASEPTGPPVVLQLATSPEAAAALSRDQEIYLRSECASGCRIVAALGAREPAEIGMATWLVTWLEYNYWQFPAVIVESALRDPPYLLARLGALLDLSFGPAAVARAADLFAARAQDAGAYCDPLGYMAAVEMEGGPGSQGPGPAAASPPAEPVAAGLLAETLRMHGSEGLVVLAPDPEAGLAEVAAVGAQACSVEEALAAAPSGPRLACLIDMVESPRLPELVQALQVERWVLCGRERSVEAVRRLCGRCLDAGVGHDMNFLFEGAEWKAYSFRRFGN